MAISYSRQLTAWLLLTTLFLFSGLTVAAELLGKVVGVSDGDSIVVLDAQKRQNRIRLAGIDAPELKQPFGQASKRSLSELVFGKQVRVQWDKKDQYGRIVGQVFLGNLNAFLGYHTRGYA